MTLRVTLKNHSPLWFPGKHAWDITAAQSMSAELNWIQSRHFVKLWASHLYPQPWKKTPHYTVCHKDIRALWNDWGAFLKQNAGPTPRVSVWGWGVIEFAFLTSSQLCWWCWSRGYTLRTTGLESLRVSIILRATILQGNSGSTVFLICSRQGMRESSGAYDL